MHSQSPDGGKAFFLEFAAKQIAIYRGLGFRGVYLGGVHNFAAIESILEIERQFCAGRLEAVRARDPVLAARRIFLLRGKSGDRPCRRRTRDSAAADLIEACHRGLSDFEAGRTHTMFAPGKPFANWGAKLCAHCEGSDAGAGAAAGAGEAEQGRAVPVQGLRRLLAARHRVSLPRIAMREEPAQRPCGGTREGRCEVDGYGDCIWLRAYERLKHDGREQKLLDHAPVVQNQGLRGTSAWANLGWAAITPQNERQRRTDVAPLPQPGA